MAETPEPTTLGLMQVLRGDVERCHEGLKTALFADRDSPDPQHQLDAEFHARQLFRAAFAFIEAVTFSVKARAAAHLLVFEPTRITDAETFLATDRGFKLASNGTVKEERPRIRLADNIRFAIALTERAKEIDTPFDANSKWWSCLQSSIKVRDRLTHPKQSEDFQLTTEEVTNLLTAYVGFNKYFEGLPTYPPIPEDKVGFL